MAPLATIPTCSLDSGSATDCVPLCSAPATHSVVSRNGSYGPFENPTCARHVQTMCGRVYPGLIEVRDLLTTTKGELIMTDTDAILAEIRALTDDDVISDGCARTIASRWAAGQRSPLAALSTTGAITDDVAESIESEHVAAEADDRTELAELLAYVRHHGTRGPVTGWSNVWVR